MNQKDKISVTVITGFLGAGKTTFINQVLKKHPEIQFALVENEFGDVAIDTKLIKGVEASRMFEMRQGCICCTISDEYELVLQELAERFPNVEHLLIETTGIADPAPVIRPFFRDENLKNIYRFNGTVGLVDALHFENYPDKEVSLKQMAAADVLLINKSEKLNAEQKQKLHSTLKAINPLADLFFAEYGNARGFDLHKISRRDYDAEPAGHSHQLLDSKTICFHQPLDKEEFIRRMEYMLDVHKNNIYRVKGILVFENEPYEHILQGVGGSFELTEGDRIAEKPESCLVFIGNLKKIEFSLTTLMLIVGIKT